jgi:hypothetical protein
MPLLLASRLAPCRDDRYAGAISRFAAKRIAPCDAYISFERTR